MAPPDEARKLRERRVPLFQIARRLGMSLSEVRRAVDPKAERAHRQWAR